MMPKRPGWQERFLSNQTRVMFQLNLTRPMLEFLCASSEDVHWDRKTWGGLFEPDNWLATERALEKRGLIERKSKAEINHNQLKYRTSRCPPPCRLTPVGEACVEMLKVGGLYIEAEQARQKFEARKGRK